MISYQKLPFYFSCAVLILIILFLFSLPSPLFKSPQSTIILDRNGLLLAAAVSSDHQWRFPQIDSVPDKFAHAAICFEDKRFLKHHGVDFIAIMRAAKLNISAQKIRSGGSTISMQVIRLSRNNQPRTIREKIFEMFLAIRLELSCNKKDVMRLYASYAPFGGNVVGIEAAGWRYFGCAPDKLSWAESAMLAVLPNSPSLIHPGKNREKLLSKRNRLLEKLRSNGVIDSTTCALAKSEPLPPKPYPLPRLAPHLLSRIEKEIKKKSSNKNGIKMKSRITTTISMPTQQHVVHTLSRHHKVLSGNGINNGAVLVIENRTGFISAYAGNISNENMSTNGSSVDIITSQRSTGSILKPLLYAAMLQSGEIISSQLVRDIPLRIGGFAPQNFNKTFEGAISAHSALARSLNVPAVSMLHDFGVDRFYDYLKKYGMTSLHRNASDYGLTLILGGAEGSLWEITSIYSGLARCVNNHFEGSSNGSRFITPLYIFPECKNYNQQLNIPSQDQIDAGAAYLTLQAMEEVNRPEDESGWEQFTSSNRISWKTGTSFGFRDAWAIGVTPDYTVGVWVGNADGEGRPGLTGTSSAAPLLFEIFDQLKHERWFQFPESEIVEIDICAKSGFRPGLYCSDLKKQKVTLAGKTSETCPYCKIIHCDSSLNFRVHSECEKVSRIISKPWFILPPVMEWYYRKKHYEYQPLPPFRDDCLELFYEKASSTMSLIYPRSGAKIYIPVELDGIRGKTIFEAAHRDSKTTLYWHIDNEYTGSTKDLHQISCSPTPGTHILTVVDENGERIERKFEILSGDN